MPAEPALCLEAVEVKSDDMAVVFPTPPRMHY